MNDLFGSFSIPYDKRNSIRHYNCLKEYVGLGNKRAVRDRGKISFPFRKKNLQ